MSPCSGLLRMELLLQNPKKRSTPFSANCCGSASCSAWLKWRAWFSPSAGSGLAFQSAMGSCKREGEKHAYAGRVGIVPGIASLPSRCLCFLFGKTFHRRSGLWLRLRR